MAVEVATFFAELNQAWPADNDEIPEGDDHTRLLKQVVNTQFPNLGIAVAVNPTAEELNHVVGVTSGIQTQLDALVAKNVSQDTDIGQNATDIATNATDIGTLNTEQGVQDGRLDAIETEQTTQNGRLTTNEGDIAANAGAISTLQAEQTTQDARLDALEADDIIPTSTRMLFRQAAVPTGWTLVADANDRVIRNNSTTGGGSGGSWVVSGITVDGHALTEAELAAHTHPDGALVLRFTSTGGSLAIAAGANTTIGGGDSQSTGSGAAHSHGLTSSGAWRPAYVDVVTGAKN